jgi:hypothetical protein
VLPANRADPDMFKGDPFGVHTPLDCGSAGAVGRVWCGPSFSSISAVPPATPVMVALPLLCTWTSRGGNAASAATAGRQPAKPRGDAANPSRPSTAAGASRPGAIVTSTDAVPVSLPLGANRRTASSSALFHDSGTALTSRFVSVIFEKCSLLRSPLKSRSASSCTSPPYALPWTLRSSMR